MVINLDKISLGYSSLTEKIYLYRYGKTEGEALDKREAEKEVMVVITEKMMAGTEKGASMEYCFGDQRYKLTVQKIDGKDNE